MSRRDRSAQAVEHVSVDDRGPVTRTQAGRDIVGQLVFRIADLALGVVTTLVLVRSLGDDRFGQWVTIFAVIGLAGSFGLQGLSNVAIERTAAKPSEGGMWVGSLVTLRLALSPFVTFVSLAVCLAIADSREMRLAAVVAHTILLTGAIAAARIVFQLRLRNTTASAVGFASSAAWGGAVLLIAFLGPSLLAMAIAFAVVTNATNIWLWYLSRRLYPFRLRGGRSGWRALVSRGLPVAFASVVTLSYGRIDQVLVFELAGSTQAGLYGAVYRIYDRLQLFPAALMTTLFPVLVAARDSDRERVRKVFNTAIDYLILASLPAFTIVLAGSEPLCVLLFGPEFAAAAPALSILTASLVVVSLGHLTGYLIISYSLQRAFVAIALVALFFNVVVNLIFVPRFGFIAAAWITLATEVLVLGASMTLLCRKVGVVPLGYHLPGIVSSAAAVGLIAWGGRLASLPTLVWASLAALAYVPILIVTRSVRLGDIRAIVGRTPKPDQSVGSGAHER